MAYFKFQSCVNRCIENVITIYNIYFYIKKIVIYIVLKKQIEEIKL